jgi:hypothetical protein
MQWWVVSPLCCYIVLWLIVLKYKLLWRRKLLLTILPCVSVHLNVSMLEVFTVNLQMSTASFDGGLHCVFYEPIILLGLLQYWNKKVCSFRCACLITHVLCRSTFFCLYIEQENLLWAYLCIRTVLQT